MMLVSWMSVDTSSFSMPKVQLRGTRKDLSIERTKRAVLPTCRDELWLLRTATFLGWRNDGEQEIEHREAPDRP